MTTSRKPLCRDKDVLRLIELGKSIHDEMNRGDLKFQHGMVAVSGVVTHYQEERAAVVARLRERYGDKLREVARHAL